MTLKNLDTCIERTVALFVTSKEVQESMNQFIKFMLIGVINTFIDFGIYYTLTRHVAFFNVATSRKYVANLISFLFATTFSFFSNRTWTFKRTDKPSMNEAFRFYSTTGSGVILNTLLLYIQIRTFHIYDLAAKVFATFVTIFWNFLFKKFWVFTPATAQKQQSSS